ncbi:unnamed protein product [Cyprideis torosa]|uniref:L-2-hydroxyglutarate dehydrogenase, mitochondrial n=1 Tax=Cyprideis torosa TaxID=163714 RepID=A0A7R8WCH5_9CRUS|nr:unnamed protein product [Cyprideis torosa]CAG0893467.1 unnamed protein product [Cyprideis torosa]
MGILTNAQVCVVGGGIVGCALARELLKRHTSLKLILLEKEQKLAAHQSGHNSGVIHAGIYYQPGSLKAKLCVEGLKSTYTFCEEHGVPYKKVGKLIVARNEGEAKALEGLLLRAQQNGVPDVCMVGAEQIREMEPKCVGKKALWSPHTGIIDWGLVTRTYGEDVSRRGGRIAYGKEVTGFSPSENSEYPVKVHINGGREDVDCQYVVTCGGLQADLLAEMSGCDRSPRIIPFRGEYLIVQPERAKELVSANIYPVPDPRFPFLGFHFTPRMDGSLWLGPNAVLAMKREGYAWSDWNMSEFWDAVRFPGFRKLALRYTSFGIKELIHSFSLNLTVKQLQTYVPSLTIEDVSRGPAGVRAQALAEDGSLVDDFVFDIASSSTNPVAKQVLHVRNAPSPAATSSLAIARMIADRFEKEFLQK